MNRIILAFAAVCLAFTASQAARLVDGVLMVDGKPFFPLSTAPGSPESMARLGANTAGLNAPSTQAMVQPFREAAREAARWGLQVTAGMGFGGSAAELWPLEGVAWAAEVADVPNLLVYYVADDVQLRHIPSLRALSTGLRDRAPHVLQVADFYGTRGPEAEDVLKNDIDIRCQYSYPLETDSLRQYAEFFDSERAFVGDPLWTWIQVFQWGNLARTYNLGREGPGESPTPNQVRVMAYIALARGVRGMLFYYQRTLDSQPEMEGEVALVCREIRAFEEHLAAGSATYDLATSDSDLMATAISYRGSVVVPLVVVRPHYGRWVDEAVLLDATVDIPWSGDSLPTAMLCSAPQATSCAVERMSSELVRVSIPRLELASFLYLSSDDSELAEVRRKIAAIPDSLRYLTVASAASQVRRANTILLRAGFDGGRATEAGQAVRDCAAASVDGDHATAFAKWRETLRISRRSTGELMAHIAARRDALPRDDRSYSYSPAALHNIRDLARLPDPKLSWRFMLDWEIVGPYALGWDGTWDETWTGTYKKPSPLPLFHATEAPEGTMGTMFRTLDGLTSWRRTSAAASGMLDLVPLFDTRDNVFCYARARIYAQSDTTVTMSMGCNDGALVTVNGREVHTAIRGGTAEPHQYEFGADLRAGENTVLVRLLNLGGGWQLFLSVRDSNGSLGLGRPVGVYRASSHDDK
jgi:hypothetical protein